ncbi:MAG TPA: hypothetical protein PLX71_02500 [Phycicoccus sp.]|nr:hypothetical protein [Phycicoccus sp.]
MHGPGGPDGVNNRPIGGLCTDPAGPDGVNNRPIGGLCTDPAVPTVSTIDQ